MNILKITNSQLNEHYFKVENEFNLPILLYPTMQFSSTSAAFATSFGSTTTSFKKHGENKFTEIADGTAHYLEHLLFENKDSNKNTFDLFARTGAQANAQTSRNSTAYFFKCTQNFEESLQILLDFVQNPYFSEQNIQKENGIIEQEIKMLDDDPVERIFNNCLKMLYFNHPARKKIGGSATSISHINKTLLQNCYDYFYSLNNMIILISGNFNLNSTLKTIEQNLKTPSHKPKIELNSTEEPPNVVKQFIKCEMAIMAPYFCIGYKIEPSTVNLIFKQKLLFEIICELLTGEGSNLQKKLYENNLVAEGMLEYSIEAGKGYFAIIFAGISNNYEKVANLLNEEIEYAQKNGFDAKLFNLVKKACFGEQIANFNSVDSLENLMLESFDLYNQNLFSSIEILSKLTIDEINVQVQLIRTENSAISVCVPKKN